MAVQAAVPVARSSCPRGELALSSESFSKFLRARHSPPKDKAMLPPTYSSEQSTTNTHALRRRSLSDGCNLKFLAAVIESEPLLAMAHSQYTSENQQKDVDSTPPLANRSKSESVITKQGVVFQSSQRYSTRLESLVELASNPASSSSNALLAQKALRYRKVLERRRAHS